MRIKATPDAAWVQVASASDTALKHGVRIPSPLPCKTQPIRGPWPSRPSLHPTIGRQCCRALPLDSTYPSTPSGLKWPGSPKACSICRQLPSPPAAGERGETCPRPSALTAADDGSACFEDCKSQSYDLSEASRSNVSPRTEVSSPQVLSPVSMAVGDRESGRCSEANGFCSVCRHASCSR